MCCDSVAENSTNHCDGVLGFILSSSRHYHIECRGCHGDRLSGRSTQPAGDEESGLPRP